MRSDHLNSYLPILFHVRGARSPHHGYDVRERDRGHHSVAELCPEGTRVGHLSSPCGTTSLNRHSENRDKTETLLAFGASRFEACRPLAVETLRLALLPTINQMRYAKARPRLALARH